MQNTAAKKGAASSRAFIYTRFSPRRQADECQSCVWQQAECEDFARKKGLTVVTVYNDPDVSGADAFRPTLWNAIDALKKGDALIVWKWDRLARDLILALQIEKAVEQRGAHVLATTGDVPGDNPQAQFTRHILMAVAELERKMIRDRTHAAMMAHQRAGRRMSARTPYGWKTNPDDPRFLVEDPAEQEVRRHILELRDSGLGLRAIARKLNEEGLKTRNGKDWEQKRVQRICSRVI